jgi:hypothetical protein
LRVEDLYARTMRELDSTWRKQANQRPLGRVRELAGQPEAKVFTQYQYPQYLTDSTILALKTGLDDIPQLVQLGRSGQQKKVFTLGLLNIPEMLSVGGGRVVWPEFRQHPRWGQQLYSELKVLDLSTGKLRRIGKNGRYAAAALSSDGHRLVAVRTDESYHHALVVLDVDNDQIIHTLPNPHNDFYQQPRWMPDGRIVTVALSAAGKTLQALDPTTGAAQNLLPWASVNLTNPQPWGEYVLYNSPQMTVDPPRVFGGEMIESAPHPNVDNIYAVSVKTGSIYQVTSQAFGAYHAAPSPDGRTLVFHDYRATGARIVEVPLNPDEWQPVPARYLIDTPDLYATKLAAGEPDGPRIAQLLVRPDSAGPRYGVRRYRPLAHAFRVFSYGVVQSPSGNAVTVGLRSQDFLSTTQLFAGVTYDQTERTVAGTAALSYQGLGPVLDVEASYGGRDAGLLYQGTVLRDQWQYARLLAGTRLPLVLTRSKYLQALTLGAYYLNEQVFGYDLPVRLRADVGPDAALHAIQTSLSYASQLKQSARDVAPRGGATLLATWRTTPFDTRLQATQVGVQAGMYLPGLAQHHALRLRGGFQYQQQAQYNFSTAISFPRAETSYVSFDRLAVGSIDYNLPLAFTHISVGRLLYVQRFRATLFGDFAQGSSLISGTRYTQDYRNAGADFLVLFNVLHLRTPVEAGVRVAYSSVRREVVVQPLAFSVRL